MLTPHTCHCSSVGRAIGVNDRMSLVQVQSMAPSAKVHELPVKAGRIKTDRAVRISNVANEWVNGDF